jgi:hypothetical protein
MSVLSGNLAAINGISCVRKWKVSPKAESKDFKHSSTKGATGRPKGVKDWTGSYDAYGAVPSAMPGVSFTGTFSIDGSLGCSGTALVENAEITINTETNENVSMTVSFGGNGALTEGAAVVADAGTAALVEPVDCLIKTCPAGSESTPESWVVLTQWKSCKMKFSAALKAFSHEGTNLWKARCAGKKDATITIELFPATVAGLPALNTDVSVRVYIDATHYYEFSYMKFTGHGDIAGDSEGSEPWFTSLEASFSVIALISGTATYGHIIMPAGTYFVGSAP